MAYALNYPNAPTNEADEANPAPQGLLARFVAAIQRGQMRRVERELAFFSPELREAFIVNGEFRAIALSDDAKLPFVK